MIVLAINMAFFLLDNRASIRITTFLKNILPNWRVNKSNNSPSLAFVIAQKYYLVNTHCTIYMDEQEVSTAIYSSGITIL